MQLKKVSTGFIRSNRIMLFFIYLFSLKAAILFAHPQSIGFYGKVYCGQEGVEGVLVTDGYSFVKTDRAGRYTINSHVDAKFIYLSTPAGYTTRFQNGGANFYHPIAQHSKGKERQTKLKQKADFELVKSTDDDSNFNVVVTADPQIGYEEEFPLLEEIVGDMKVEIDRLGASNTLGIVCGDLVEDIKDAPAFYDRLKHLFANTGAPFYYISGNHDMETEMRSNFNSKKTYESYFGPNYYSFYKGDIHFVFLDNVFHTGRDNSYIGYLKETQLAWLEKNLSFVPTDKVIMLIMHIPTYSTAARNGEYAKEQLHKVLQNRQSLYKLLKNYKVHIFTGHEHYQENYLINDDIYEHVQPALSGMFWQAPYNSDGTPLGYTVYQVNGKQVSWYFKASGQGRDVQLDAYKAGSDKNRPYEIIANVWNYDPDWKVYWHEDGKRVGEMTRYRGWDPAIVDYVEKHQQNFRYKYIGAGPTEHLFRATPQNPAAEITIQVIDRFNNRSIRVPRTIDEKE